MFVRGLIKFNSGEFQAIIFKPDVWESLPGLFKPGNFLITKNDEGSLLSVVRLDDVSAIFKSADQSQMEG